MPDIPIGASDVSEIAKLSLWGVQLIPPIWLGILIGISFLATPVKFKVAALTLPVALDVGRETFHLLNVTEWVTALILVASLVLSTSEGWKVSVGIGLLFCVALQTFWLLPALDARVAVIIGGGSPIKSYHHVFYGAIEVVKALALVTLTISTFHSLRTSAGL